MYVNSSIALLLLPIVLVSLVAVTVYSNYDPLTYL